MSGNVTPYEDMHDLTGDVLQKHQVCRTFSHSAYVWITCIAILYGHSLGLYPSGENRTKLLLSSLGKPLCKRLCILTE